MCYTGFIGNILDQHQHYSVAVEGIANKLLSEALISKASRLHYKNTHNSKRNHIVVKFCNNVDIQPDVHGHVCTTVSNPSKYIIKGTHVLV